MKLQDFLATWLSSSSQIAPYLSPIPLGRNLPCIFCKTPLQLKYLIGKFNTNIRPNPDGLLNLLLLKTSQFISICPRISFNKSLESCNFLNHCILSRETTFLLRCPSLIEITIHDHLVLDKIWVNCPQWTGYRSVRMIYPKKSIRIIPMEEKEDATDSK